MESKKRSFIENRGKQLVVWVGLSIREEFNFLSFVQAGACGDC